MTLFPDNFSKRPAPRPRAVRASRWLTPRRIVTVLCGAIAALLLANLYSHLFLPADSTWGRMLDVNREKNIATAFSVLLLFGCAALLRQIYIAKRGQPFFNHWRGLSALFLLMAIDEGALLHERLNMFLDDHFHTRGIFYYDWVIPASLFVLVFVMTYARFITHLPAATRRRFLMAGTLYIAGAVGMEMVSGYYIDTHLDTHGIEQSATLALMNGIEEAAEMLGAVCFLRGLLLYVKRMSKDIVHIEAEARKKGVA